MYNNESINEIKRFQGKTTLFLRLLEQATSSFNPVPSRIWFLYNCHQPIYEEMHRAMNAMGIDFRLSKTTDLTEENLKSMRSTVGQTMICVDDSTIAVGKSMNMAHLFTISRHYNCSMVLFMHTVFGSQEALRIISLNTAYYFLMSSPRLRGQVGRLGDQLGLRKQLVAAYDQKVSSPYSYLLLDFNVTTPNINRIRDDVI